MLTNGQIAWARQHDWFIRDNGDGSITVRDVYCLDDTPRGVWLERPLIFTSFRLLRAWAGY